MINLKSTRVEKDINIPNVIKKSFNKNLVFFLKNTEDPTLLLISFVVIDFKNNKLIYLHTFNKENREMVGKLDYGDNFKMRIGAYEPHSVIKISESEFMLFYEDSSYYYKVNLEAGDIKIFGREDNNLPGFGKAMYFGSTFHKDNENSDIFYFTATNSQFEYTKKMSDTGRIGIFKSDLELNNIEEVFSQSSKEKFPVCPHETRKFGRYIFSSNFYNVEFKIKGEDRVITGDFNFKKELYKYIYKTLCTYSNKEYSKKDFNKYFKVINQKIYINGVFNDFYTKLGEKVGSDDPFTICKYLGIKFNGLPGDFLAYDLKNKKINKFKTTFCKSAHFEIDEENNSIYVSSHNFIRIGKPYYLGPAAIDKFEIFDNEIKKTGTFSDIKGYRFASHKVLKHNGSNYICATGFPNRLFIIDAENMKLNYFLDIENNDLSKIEKEDEINKYMNSFSEKEGSSDIRALIPSEDGKYILLIGGNKIFIVDFVAKKKIFEHNYIYEGINSIEGIEKSEFVKNTIHMNYS